MIPAISPPRRLGYGARERDPSIKFIIRLESFARAIQNKIKLAIKALLERIYIENLIGNFANTTRICDVYRGLTVRAILDRAPINYEEQGPIIDY